MTKKKFMQKLDKYINTILKMMNYKKKKYMI